MADKWPERGYIGWEIVRGAVFEQFGLDLNDLPSPEIAVLGVDTDCRTCARGGLDRLTEAMPGVDWPMVLHDTLHDPDDENFWPPYWCDHCGIYRMEEE